MGLAEGADLPLVVLLVGPQASGKSTLAAALTASLRQDGETVALVELDAIAAMALPTLPGWDVAARIFAVVVEEWARSAMTCVVAEGCGSREEVEVVLARLPAEVRTVVVAVTAGLSAAFARAQQDPSRGVSRHWDFLAEVYSGWPAELRRLVADVVVDTEATTVDEGVEQLRSAAARARSSAFGRP